MSNDAENLVCTLEKDGVLTSPALAAAFREVDRADFVPFNQKDMAHADIPLSIGCDQTISQPYTVAFMLEQLDVQLGQNILEIGYGSGWQTALLSHLVGSEGSVCALEIVPELCEMGAENIQQYPDLSRRVHLRCRNAEHGWEEMAPFDRIIAAAAVTSVPEVWRTQLNISGRMLYPCDGEIVLECKNGKETFEREHFPGFAFVPFIHDR